MIFNYQNDKKQKMPKVVISTKYGGYGLSKPATEWLARKGVSSAIEYLKKNEDDSWFSWSAHDIDRHDPLLVECVETLGSEASGSGADLQVEVITGNVYKIDEYDGFESVIEPDDIVWQCI